MNRAGLEYLRGRLAVPKKIYCRAGQVIEKSTEEVRVQDVKKVILDKTYWDNYDKLQKYPTIENGQLLLLP